MHRGKLTNIVCTVENVLSPCVPWKIDYHRVYRGKLTDIVVFNAPWKTYYHFVYRGKLTIIVCTVEN